MKKLYFTALSLVFGFGLSAQTLTLANNGQVAGDRYTTSDIDPGFVPSAISGAGSAWNYTPVFTTVSPTNYTATANANPVYTLATISISGGGSNLLYFKPSATDNKYYGGYLNINGVAGQITYTSPAVLATYPMSFGISTVSPVSGSLTALGQPGTFDGTCTATADGTGTLTLPSRTFNNVIRIYTNQILNFIVPGASVNGTITQSTYNYYSLSDSKYPILTHVTSYVQDNLGTSTQSTSSLQQNYQTVGLKENAKEEISLNVYPNPSSSIVNFVTENNNVKSISMYDITGKLVETRILNNGKLSLNVADYNNGVYIYKLNGSDNAALKTGKLTVTH